MAVEKLTDEEIESRMDYLEQLITHARPKELPALHAIFQKLFDEQVRRDLQRDEEPA